MNLLKRMLWTTVACATVTLVLSWAGPALASDAGLAAANQVSADSYRDFLDLWLYTHVGDDRGFGPEHDLAQANIAQLFGSYGLFVTLEPVQYGGDTYYNVVGTKPGVTVPDQEFVLGAHYDSVNNPGADDDASGVALVLEAARILTQYDSDATIRFVAFDREEQGLHGSYAYVADHADDNIVCMIQADMVAHDPGTNHVRIFGSGVAQNLKTGLMASVDMYGDGLTAADYGYSGGSDHVPFDQVGIPASLMIENIFNPYYHSPDDNFDNPDNLNFAYASRITRAVVGYLVDHAGVDVPFDGLAFTHPDGLPEFIDPAGGTRIRVEVTGIGAAVPALSSGMLHYDVGGGWMAEPMEVIANNVYDAVMPGAECGREVLYYFGAEDAQGQVYTDPHSGSYASIAAYGLDLQFVDNFEADTGWSVAGDAAAGMWERGVPVGGGDRGDPAADHDGSGQCYLTANQDGDSDVDGGYAYLMSPTMDLSAGDALIHYALWYTNNNGGDPNNDLFKIYVSNNNGFQWSLVETVGPATTSGWVVHEFSVADHVTPTDMVRVQFEVSDLGSGSVVEAGIDDYVVFNFQCSPSADLNGDGVVDAADLALLLGNWGPCPDCPADLDGSGAIDAADLALLLGSWG